MLFIELCFLLVLGFFASGLIVWVAETGLAGAAVQAKDSGLPVLKSSNRFALSAGLSVSSRGLVFFGGGTGFTGAVALLSSLMAHDDSSNGPASNMPRIYDFGLKNTFPTAFISSFPYRLENVNGLRKNRFCMHPKEGIGSFESASCC